MRWPPAKPIPRLRGFTLLEILVVIFIIAIVATTVSVSNFDNRSRESQRAIERLRILLEAVAIKARWTGKKMAFVYEDNQYYFLEWLANEEGVGWQRFEEENKFRERTLEDWMLIESLTIDGVVPPTDDERQLLIFDRRTMPLFHLTIAGDTMRETLVGIPTGAVVYQSDLDATAAQQDALEDAGLLTSTAH